MKNKRFDAVEFKQKLQEKAIRKLYGLSTKQQIDFLQKRFDRHVKLKEIAK